MSDMAKRHTPEVKAQVSSLRAQGLSYTKIAEEVNISAVTVRYMCSPKFRATQITQATKKRKAAPLKHAEHCKNYLKNGGSSVRRSRDQKRYEHNPGVRVLHRLRSSGHAPSWLSGTQLEEMRLIYVEARAKGLEVDHVHPLNGKNVCGLHVPWNLQLINKLENAKKGNSMV